MMHSRVKHLAVQLHTQCEGDNLSVDCYKTQSEFVNEATAAKVKATITAEEGLKLNLVRILVNAEEYNNNLSPLNDKFKKGRSDGSHETTR